MVALDFIVLCLLCVALVAGFEKGLFKSFSLLLACFFAMIISLSCAPAIMDFLEESFGQFKLGYQFAATTALFLFLTLVIFHLLQIFAQKDSTSYLRQAFGSTLLVAMMLFSIGIMSGFMLQSGIITEEKVRDSYSYRVIKPVQDITAKILDKAIAGADAIKERSHEHRRTLLSQVN